MTEEELRRDIIKYSHRVHQNGWVANHDGNLSCRLDEGLFLATPTAVSKADVRPEMLIVVNETGKVMHGTRRVFSEFKLHRAAYESRPDIGAVIHAHPPTATGFCVANIPLGDPFMAEPVVSLGARIPLIPFRLPSAEDLFERIAEGLADADVLMLANHGVLAVGGSFEQAFLRLELVEHIAKIALVAHQLGGAVSIPTATVEALRQKGRPPSQPSFGEPLLKPSTSERSQSKGDVNQLVADALKRFQPT
ncbi:MAG: class II aldolase/adducin family protein [Myxococcota bacterium]|nr:class II aldolase/adducin family protein [Myxococcota bacterium]